MTESFEAARQRWQHDQGMIPKDSVSLRDQFAMAALTGVGLAAPGMDYEMIAKLVYGLADACMAERDKKR